MRLHSEGLPTARLILVFSEHPVSQMYEQGIAYTTPVLPEGGF